MAYRTQASNSSRIPAGIPYIIGNEAAERFSFYGMKAILVTFIANYLHLMGDRVNDAFSENEASDMVYWFNIAVYATPVIGAIIADVWWGKYRTIIYLSVVYCLGHLALALMGVSGEAKYWLFAGLFLIALGAGGIKPCVSAHVGDQFGINNQHKLTTTFNWFYFSINLGAAIAGILIPVLLHDYGPHIAFGIPGILMAIATFLFYFGRKSFVHIPASATNFRKTILSVDGIKSLLKISVIFAFVPVFWALFDQTSTTWVYQAEDMNRNLFGYLLTPAQIQAVNPFLILILIPIFTYVFYPLISKFFPLTPLRKMSIGLFLTTAAFAVSALIQENIENGITPHIAWQFLSYFLITSAEIMVSIVCLEFAYTQAHNSMKSAIMSIFLLTVATGNFINIAINKALYSPSPHNSEIAFFTAKKKLEPDARHIEIPSPYKNSQIHVFFNSKGAVSRREIPSMAELGEAALEIQRWSNRNNQLPLTSKGQSIIQGIMDKWGNQIHYRLENGKTARLRSMGPDQEDKTAWDSILTLRYTSPKGKKEDNTQPDRQSWLEKREAKLGLYFTDNDTYKSPNQLVNFNLEYSVGGVAKVEGANHFWLFTALMFLTAIAFIPVSIFYRKTSQTSPPSIKHDCESDQANPSQKT